MKTALATTALVKYSIEFHPLILPHSFQISNSSWWRTGGGSHKKFLRSKSGVITHVSIPYFIDFFYQSERVPLKYLFALRLLTFLVKKRILFHRFFSNLRHDIFSWHTNTLEHFAVARKQKGRVEFCLVNWDLLLKRNNSLLYTNFW